MVTQSQDNQFWKTVHANVQAMLTQHGQALVNEEAGVITVIDRPMIVRRIGRYLAALDRAMQREVSIVVRVYALDLTNSELRGFSLNGVFNNLARNYGVTFAGAAPATSVSGAASLSATILNTAGRGDRTICREQPSGPGARHLRSCVAHDPGIRDCASGAAVTD
ncbi:type II and III secretion system protein [mine drainage metagenome]|uniref:Type II and III secretion system protein n=1 Tax=mine drainage metagenome TaxID=410659 RepID=T1CJ09_9ZZZZ